MQLKKKDFFWLRVCTLKHYGLTDGAPWNVNPDLFSQFETAGLVASDYNVDDNTGREYRYAVATPKAYAIIQEHGRMVSGEFHGKTPEKWSERLDSNQRPLSPQETPGR